jgi:exopolyphosphatase/guanosine-5'-triphosphate,3'-diphosphate pyrophosphatase
MVWRERRPEGSSACTHTWLIFSPAATTPWARRSPGNWPGCRRASARETAAHIYARSDGVAGTLRTAGIDIGTNSVRLLTGEFHHAAHGPSLQTLRRLMTITRLGEGVDEHGLLNPDAVERTMATLRSYRGLMRTDEVEAWEVAATSAARDASNASVFMQHVEEIMETPPRVLSGEEEASLSFLGATYDLRGFRPQKGNLLVVDIGGGSTEVIVGGDGRILEAFSIDVGCVRMSERFLASDPPLPRELREMEDHIRRELAPRSGRVSRWEPVLMLGLAGTITTLSGLKQGLERYDGDAIHHSWLNVSDVEALYKRLYSLPLVERREAMKLEPGRADVIVGGTAVLLVFLRELDIREFLVSEEDILDGLAIIAALKAAG